MFSKQTPPQNKFVPALLAAAFALLGLAGLATVAQQRPRIEFEPNASRDDGTRRLYLRVDGKRELLEDAAVEAWLLNDGKLIAYSTKDGGGFSGERLYLYVPSTKSKRVVLSKYAIGFDGISEVVVGDGVRLLFVRMSDVIESDDGTEASHLSVVDASRGQILFVENALLTSLAGGVAKISHFRDSDWPRINRSSARRSKSTAIAAPVRVRPRRTESIDLRKLSANPVIVDDGIEP